MRIFRCIGPSLLLFASLPALADTTPVGGSGGGVSGTGTFTTTSNGNGSYTISAITGTGVTSLLAPGSFQGNDNLLFPNSTPTLDADGFAFTDTNNNANYTVDIFASASNQYTAQVLDADGNSIPVPVNFTLGPAQPGSNGTETFTYTLATGVTPEPATFALLASGLLGLAATRKRRHA